MSASRWTDFPAPFSVAQRTALLAQVLAPSGGIYIEAGAHDGIFQSNTLLLEERGWTGMLIEPSPAAFAQLQKNRPGNTLVNCALTSELLTDRLWGTFADGRPTASALPELQQRHPAKARFRGENRLRGVFGLSKRVQLQQVPATTLEDLAARSGYDSIDLLSLDVEGMELECLKGLGKLRPALIVVETRLSLAMAISDKLLELGYGLVANLSEFTTRNNPSWTRDMQDYAWVRKCRFTEIAASIDD